MKNILLAWLVLFSINAQAQWINDDVVVGDTLSNDILLLEEKIKLLTDSLNTLYSECITIVESEDAQTRATKELAAKLLGTSNDLSVITYIFDKKNELNFELIDYSDDHLLDFYRMEAGGQERTAMKSLIGNKLHSDKYSKGIIDRNWVLLPFFIKYWGNEEWNKKPSSISTIVLESISFTKLVSGYSKPWLLLEFMEANMENPNTYLMNHLKKIYNPQNE